MDSQGGPHRGGSGTGLWLAAAVSLGLVIGGSLAHIYELPHKIHMSAENYLTVQGIYRGWAFLGIPIGIALLSTFGLALKLRAQPSAFRWALASCAAIAAGQLVFWVWTYPVNLQTHDWTTLPAEWQALRLQWEYSHAADAVFNLAALATLVLSMLNRHS